MINWYLSNDNLKSKKSKSEHLLSAFKYYSIF